MRVQDNDLSYEQQIQKRAIPFRAGLPRLFVCGDSISGGCTPALKAALPNRFNVTHRRDLAVHCPQIVKSLRPYTGMAPSLIEHTRAAPTSPDYQTGILLLNCGLHDSERGAAQDKERRYEADLGALVALAAARQIRLVWVQTTPKAAGQPLNSQIVAFNPISARIMAKHAVPFIDLHAFCRQLIAERGEEKTIRPDNGHFTASASEARGRFIAAQLTSMLESKIP